MRQKLYLTLDDVLAMKEACKAEAIKNKWEVSIAIVDDSGILFSFERMDDAAAGTAAFALAKAETAAATKRSTFVMEQRVRESPGFATLRGTHVQGGLPILHEGHCLGGIGISGVKSEFDEQIAQAGLDALAART